MLLSANIIEDLRTPFSIQCLMQKIPPISKNKLYNKTIHLKIEPRLHANFVPPAPSRRPRGTSSKPLNAAWFPT